MNNPINLDLRYVEKASAILMGIAVITAIISVFILLKGGFKITMILTAVSYLSYLLARALIVIVDQLETIKERNYSYYKKKNYN